MKGSLPLIDVSRAIKFGGQLKNGLPRLALATYKMSFKGKKVYVEVKRNGRVDFYSSSAARNSDRILRLPKETFPRRSELQVLFSLRPYTLEARTAVPLVPPELRQEDSKKKFVLFEVNEWEDVPRPIDPYLLLHVQGYIYAVLGSWDVTEKELSAYQASSLLKPNK